ncbi:uncharacterized protein TNCV_3045241 [Trichonephila clavipes]|nr:uncharacterized protein TNCV_3045241 [Trichonephila clavipes]
MQTRTEWNEVVSDGFSLLFQVVPGWGPALQSGRLFRGHYWFLNLGLALPHWSSENQKEFSSSFPRTKKIKISQNKEKIQNASFKTPIPPYPTHDVHVLPTLNIDTVSTHTRFLLISLPNNDMSKISPFAIHKTLIGIGGEPKSVKRLHSGDLLIETISDLQTKSFVLAKSFLNSPVTVSPHKTLNSCRGVISEPDLLSTPDAEILEGFSDQGVIQKIRSKKLKPIKTSYFEARKLIVPQLTQTYAQATRPSTISTTSQTVPNITNVICPPLQCLTPISSKNPLPSTSSSISTFSTSSSTQENLLPSPSGIIPTIQSESLLQIPIPTTTTTSPGNNLNTLISPLETKTRSHTTPDKLNSVSTENLPESVPNASNSDHSNAAEAQQFVKRKSRNRRKQPKVQKPDIDIKRVPH